MIIGLGLLAGCSAQTDETEPVPDSPAAAHGQALEIYRRARCDRCHGENRQGTKDAPPIANLGEFWTEDDLVTYLADPQSAVETNERLQVLVARYRLIMPGYKVLSEEERRALARYLMEN